MQLKQTAFLIILMYMNKKVVGVILSITALFALPFGLHNLSSSDSVNAKEVSSIFVANVTSVLSQSIDSCGTVAKNSVSLTNAGATGGNHFSSCYITVHNTTNAPGYNLMIQAIDGVRRASVDGSNKWVYDTNGDGKVDGTDNYAIPYGDGSADGNTRLMEVKAENTPPTLPTLGTNYIDSTTATMAAPSEMNASVSPYISTWGFAVPKAQSGTAASYFDTSYSEYSSSGGSTHGKYARVPTTASVIRSTSTTAANDSTQVYFGTSISPSQPAGVYKGVVLFTATANSVVSPAPVVVAIYPDNGPLAGGTTLDIYGTAFTAVTGVTIGGTTCGSVALISDSHLTCVLPAKSAGSYAVVVTTTYGQSNDNIQYTYTATPTDPGPNPYLDEEGADIAPLVAGRFSTGGGSSTTDTTSSIEPQGRSVFENLADSVGDDNYNDMWLAIGGGALLAALLVLLSFLLGRRWDIYIMKELGENRTEVVRILVEKVGLDAKDVVASLVTVPSLVVEGVSKSDAKKIVELFEGAQVKEEDIQVVRHGRDPEESDDSTTK